MDTIQLKQSPDGTYSCDLPITIDEWQEILSNPQVTTSNYKDALMAFYNEPDHKASCKTLGFKYYGNGADAQKFNIWITKFGIAVTKHLNKFTVLSAEGGKETFWPIAMESGKTVETGLFEWTLRPEIVQAIENIGWNKHFTWIPFYMEMADKLLQFKDDRQPLLDLIYSLDEKYVKYIKTDDGGHVSDVDPFTVYGIFNRGITNENRIKLCKYFKEKLGLDADIPSEFDGIPVVNNMMATFYWRENIATDIQPLWELFDAVLNNDVSQLSRQFDTVCKQQGIKWNITMGLYWIRPYDYIALDSRNRDYLPTIGIDVFTEKNLDAKHYLKALNNVKESIQKKAIEEESIPEISYNAWLKMNTNTQNQVWLFLAGKDANDDHFEEMYQDGVMALCGWDLVGDLSNCKDLQSIETKRQSVEEYKFNTLHLGNMLQAIANEIKEDDIILVKRSKSDIVGMGVVTSDYYFDDATTYGKHCRKVNWINKGLWHCDTILQKVGKYEFPAKALTNVSNTKKYPYIPQIIKMLEGNTKESLNNQTMNYQPYIDILKENHNLVLTGAPGTGKTYMAKAIAKEMDAVTEFVQFHPSYDYTDFVEGLRPLAKADGTMGFERKDGIFKEFCKKALGIEITKGSTTFDELYDEFAFELYTEGHKSIEASNSKDLDFYVDIPIRENLTDIQLKKYLSEEHNYKIKRRVNQGHSDLPVERIDVQRIFQWCLDNKIPDNDNMFIDGNFFANVKKTAENIGLAEKTASWGYEFAIAYYLLKKYRKYRKEASHQDIQKKDKSYVMIIDEINRGEASKIFGELFYAIDPGYRGNQDIKVKTQYQNLVPEGDVFSDGFYVPENVYILATMNDIDRSVESMDFAMRRRFTWKEVTPADTESMLDNLQNANEAKQAMHRLNKEIAETDGLGSAYMVGPSYFLKLGKPGYSMEKLWTMNLEPLLKEYLRGFRKVDETMKKFKAAYENTVVE